jgi:hypothetical protein
MSILIEINGLGCRSLEFLILLSKTLQQHKLHKAIESYFVSLDQLESLIDFQCPICEKMLATRNAALRHRKEVHADVAESPEVCRSSIADSDGGDMSTDDATKRLLATTATIMKVNCPKCPKTFKNKSNLKIHMLTHSGVKPFG